MTQRIGAAVLILQLATAITLVLVADLIARMKDIRELVVVPAVIIAREIHKTRDILQAPVVEQPALMENQTPATNAHITTALTAILIIAGTIITAIVDVAVGAVAIIVALVVVVVVLLAVQAVVAVAAQVVVQLRREVPAKTTSCQV